MIRAALAFFILALLAFIFGASGIAGVSMEIGKFLVIVFLVLAVVSYIVGLVRGNGRSQIL